MKSRFALAAALGLALAKTLTAEVSVIQLNDNAGWCWFEGPRAIVDVDGGYLIAGTIANAAGPGGADRSGVVEISVLNLKSKETKVIPIGKLPADDHNTPALMLRPDGKYLAVYAAHSSDKFTRWRVSKQPHNPFEWEDEQKLDNGAGTTYCNVYRLNDGKTYNGTRSIGFNPNIMISEDDGTTWKQGGRLIEWPRPKNDPKFTGRDGGRPYVQYAATADALHFISSDDHPRAYDNSIYHGYIKDGKVFDSTGKVVNENIFDLKGDKPSAFTPVWSSDGEKMGHAWPADFKIDSSGKPFALLTARATKDDTDDHRFLYARFDGSAWKTTEIAKAGHALYKGEDDYTGLGALDRTDPNTIVISSPIDPAGGKPTEHRELYRGSTTDGGATWTWTPITHDSTQDNIRPQIVAWDGGKMLLWTRGVFTTFVKYNLALVAMPLDAAK